MKLRLVIGCLLMVSAAALAQLQQTFDRVRPSVVKVRTADTGHAATGFVWQSADLIVTSLHVVDGSTQIIVDYVEPRVSRSASVERVLKDADLVLLKIKDAPQVKPLRSSHQLPTIEDEIHALGYPLNTPEINSFSFKQRYGGRRLQDNVSAKVLAKLRQNGYPDPGLEVIKLGSESLLPGLSGAPIFDSKGVVVAIGNGGLEEGALNISWGIPAAQLTRLGQSTQRQLPGSKGTSELFAAELEAQMGQEVQFGEVRLIKVRTRNLAQLMGSADDQLGLNQLANAFAMFNPLAFQYDIYQDVNTGATLVVPAESVLKPRAGEPWQVTLPFSQAGLPIWMYVMLEETDSVMQAQNLSVQFETWISQQYDDTQWAADPQWSYLTPFQRFDGLVVNRKAWVGMTWFGDTKYAFETLALRNLTFLGAIGVRQDAPAQLMQYCISYNWQPPQCQQVQQLSFAWAHLVLGLQLSGFSL